MEKWAEYGSVAQGAPAPVQAPSAGADDTEVCAFSGKRYPKSQMVNYEGQWISAEHRDEYFQRIREGVAVPGKFNYGGFWTRFSAKIVDGIVLYAVTITINIFLLRRWLVPEFPHTRPGSHLVLFQVVSALSNLTIAIIYAVIFISKYDATPGKMAVGLKLLRSNGTKLSVGRIIGRYFAELLSTLTLFIGYIMAGVDAEKRALHDRICDTRVVRAK